MIRIFDHYFHRRALLQGALDFVLVVVAVILAFVPLASQSVIVSGTILTRAVLLAAGVLVINTSLGFYQRSHNRTVGQSRARAVMALFLSLPLSYAIFGLWPPNDQDDRLLLAIVLLSYGVILINRVHSTHGTPGSMLRQRVMIFGMGKRAKMVGRSLKNADPNVDLVGYYAGPNELVSEISGWGLLEKSMSLTDIAVAKHVDLIVVALAERRGGSMPLRELLDCKLQGIRVIDIATHFEKTLGQIRLDSVSAGWLIFGDGFASGWCRTGIKRVFDIVFAALLIVLTFPLMLVTALLIMWESGGPVFYRQERVGLHGRLFNVVKFRSMRRDAEKDGTPRWASASDDRITRVGRVIRKLRIDELPQLFKVIGGDMSLVGPRPERPYFVDQLTREIPYFAVRQSVKPGITGWAQVRYHYGSSTRDAAEKLQYDLYYVKHHSLFLDLVVLFETIGVVVTGRGAQ